MKTPLGKFCWLLVMMVMLSPLCLGAQQEEKFQEVVIGTGFGPYQFAKGDQIRLPTYGEVFQVYLEWYAFDQFGFGLRSLKIKANEVLCVGGQIQGSGCQATGEMLNLNIDIHLVTVQFLQFISDKGYNRLGLLAGRGIVDYEVEVGTADGSTDGSARLFAFFYDWGGDDLGGRVGFASLDTNLKNLTQNQEQKRNLRGLVVDASGWYFHIDLRMALF